MTEFRKNEIYESTVQGYTSEGDGVCRIDGRAVFVKGALMGENIRVRILKDTKTVVYGRLEEILTPSESRIEPVCPVFSKCGGCVMQNADYEEELRFKKNKVDAALERIGGLTIKTDCIHGSEKTEGYRNKAIFAVGGEKGNAYCGFFRRHTHDVTKADTCSIQAEYASRAANAVTDWMNQNGIAPYEEKTAGGVVRHVFARYAFKTGEGQVTVVVSKMPKYTDKLVDIIRNACPETVSIVININKTRGNTVLDGEFITLWGREYIEEELCGLRFRLSPRAFFQINRDQAEKLYNKAAEFANLDKSMTVLDLYCGTGTITLRLAREAGKAIGAEIVPPAIENAIENAANNAITNAEFMCADAAVAAEKLAESGVKPDVVVVDPPRKGLDARVIEIIAEMRPERVVYVSCEPSTLARDLKIFASSGYETVRAEAYDLFPRTEHVETVCLMSRKEK